MKLSRKLRAMREGFEPIEPNDPWRFFSDLNLHGIASVCQSEEGYEVSCACGFHSKPCKLMAEAGALFDEHLGQGDTVSG